jgi:hypothetical protein
MIETTTSADGVVRNAGVLGVYASTHGRTAKIAARLAIVDRLVHDLAELGRPVAGVRS